MSHHQPPEFHTSAFHEAKAILALIGRDPDSAKHRHDLLQAIGALCIVQRCTQESRSGHMCARHNRQHRRLLAAIRANQTETLNRKAAA